MKANDKKNAMIAAWYLKEYCCTQEECESCFFYKGRYLGGYECAIYGDPVDWPVDELKKHIEENGDKEHGKIEDDKEKELEMWSLMS